MAAKGNGKMTGKPVTYRAPGPASGVQMETFIPWTLVKRRVRREIITPLDAPSEFRQEAALERRERQAAQDTPLMRALGLAHHWQRLLDEGKFVSLTEIADAEGIDLGQTSRIARLVYLAPNLVEIGLAKMNNGLALESLARRQLPTDWSEQRTIGASK